MSRHRVALKRVSQGMVPFPNLMRGVYFILVSAPLRTRRLLWLSANPVYMSFNWIVVMTAAIRRKGGRVLSLEDEDSTCAGEHS